MTNQRYREPAEPWVGTWTCAVNDCDKSRKCSRGRPTSRYCSTHTSRLVRTGSVDLRPRELAPDCVYRTAHTRVERAKGRAAQHVCITCGIPAEEWAYDHNAPDEQIEQTRGMPYSGDPDHYQPMCRKCHAAFDHQFRPKGRGRKVRGEEHSQAKLTETEVRDIRAVAGVESTQSIADRYGIHACTVRRIIRREKWAHVT